MNLLVRSSDDMVALGETIGRALAAPQRTAAICLALEGGLGAGKTQFVRGLARGLAVADPSLVSSPTYVLMNIYEGSGDSPGERTRRTLYHLDAYRVSGGDELEAVGFSELFETGDETNGGSGAVIAIEWASRVAEILPSDRLELAFDRRDDEGERDVAITATGPASAALLAAIFPAGSH